jgi:pSer/pThr/pTyr-binding forkhead associated (FHA) protein
MRPGAARVEVTAGNAAGTWVVVEDELVIGRTADEPGRLADDEEISRTHARIALDGNGHLAIEDLGSTNGTFVNGVRISGPKMLSEDDAIELGGTTLVVRELPEVGAAEPASFQAQALPPTAASAPAGPIPPLALRIEIDFATREARIHLDDVSEPVRLRHADGEWRVVSAGS